MRRIVKCKTEQIRERLTILLLKLGYRKTYFTKDFDQAPYLWVSIDGPKRFETLIRTNSYIQDNEHIIISLKEFIKFIVENKK